MGQGIHSLLPNPKHPVACGSLRGLPKPTAIRYLRYLFPETLLGRPCFSRQCLHSKIITHSGTGRLGGWPGWGGPG